ncbi:MAG: prolyl oligopeptidase family serine peptidase [Nakamurella sp.]
MPKQSSHPAAVVPATLFDDPEREQRWRTRFSAVRVSLPDWARDNPDHAVYISNASGRYEVSCWDVPADVATIATDRPDGTVHATLSADGETLWWFDDTAGDEFGSWRAQPFGAAADPGATQGAAVLALPTVPAGYPAGLEVGRSTVLAGFSDDDGTRIYLASGGTEPVVVYQHVEDGGVGALSTDENIWVLSHSEHGDSRYPALRAFSQPSGDVIGELSDAPGKGLAAVSFSPVPGDQRLLVGHERRGRDELLIWDLASGAATDLLLDLPGDLDADFYPDGQALLVVHTHAGRTTVHRYEFATGAVTDLPVNTGVVSGASARPDGSVWYRWSSAAAPGQLRVLRPNGSDEVLLRPAGAQAPGSEPVSDIWVDGPGGPIHALLGIPADPDRDGDHKRGWPTVFAVHGGPAAGDEDSFDASRAAWLDAGFAVVQVNYRGSTGYGSAWRDALTERIGHTELADIAAVYDQLVADGAVDPARAVIAGYSWGGYLALLALGVQPERWAAGVAGVPVADYVAAYEDEMEPLRAYDRALCGGSPQDVPDAYRDSSPNSYIDRVRSPVLILAGENDPRCPIRQIDNYLDLLAERDVRYALYRYDAGHGSMVVAERMRQVACEIAFVRDVLQAH